MRRGMDAPPPGSGSGTDTPLRAAVCGTRAPRNRCAASEDREAEQTRHPICVGVPRGTAPTQTLPHATREGGLQVALPALAARYPHAVFAAVTPSSLIISSRMTNFWILPVIVIGNWSTKRM